MGWPDLCQVGEAGLHLELELCLQERRKGLHRWSQTQRSTPISLRAADSAPVVRTLYLGALQRAQSRGRRGFRLPSAAAVSRAVGVVQEQQLGQGRAGSTAMAGFVAPVRAGVLWPDQTKANWALQYTEWAWSHYLRRGRPVRRKYLRGRARNPFLVRVTMSFRWSELMRRLKVGDPMPPPPFQELSSQF